MAPIFKLSSAASLGLHAMAYISMQNGIAVTSQNIVEHLPISKNHLAKVLQRLASQKLLVSVRGPGGGFKLAKPPSKITLLQIYEAIEGEVEIAECLFSGHDAGTGECLLGGFVGKINRDVGSHMGKTTLAMLLKKTKSKARRKAKVDCSCKK